MLLLNNFTYFKSIKVYFNALGKYAVSYIPKYYSSKSHFKTSIDDALEKRINYPTFLKPILKPKNIPKLKESVQKRGLEYDFNNLDKYFKAFSKLRKKAVQMNFYIKEIEKKIENTSDVAEKEELVVKLKDRQSKYKKLHSEEVKNYELLTVNMIRLPNALHELVPENSELVEIFNGVPHSTFQVQSHLDIAEHNGVLEIIESSPNLFYLKDQLAILELLYSDYLLKGFINNEFILQSNPSIWKPVMFEACGFDHNDMDEVICVKKDLKLPHSADLYLSGAASPCSFSAYFAQGSVSSEKVFPIRSVGTGRRYKPNKNTNLYNLIQSNYADSFIMCTDAEKLKEMNLIKDIITGLYKNIGFHFKIINYGPKELTNFESLSYGFLVYSIYHQNFIEVGRISLCEDYISKRILARYNDENKKNLFTCMIYAQIADINKLIALTIENFQNEDLSFNIPDCLKGNEYSELLL